TGTFPPGKQESKAAPNFGHSHPPSACFAAIWPHPEQRPATRTAGTSSRSSPQSSPDSYAAPAALFRQKPSPPAPPPAHPPGAFQPPSAKVAWFRHLAGAYALPRPRVQHGKHRHARNRNIQPDGKREPRNFSMLRKPPGQRKEKRDQHHRQRHRAQNNVADENRKIHRPHHSHALIKHVPMQRVIHGIHNQKNTREDQRRNHRPPVRPNVPPPNEVKPRNQANPRQPVHQRVQSRQKQQPVGKRLWRRMHINQPEQKRRRRRAQGNHPRDRGLVRLRSSLRNRHGPSSSWHSASAPSAA